jgi:hypothetical protein
MRIFCWAMAVDMDQAGEVSKAQLWSGSTEL